MRLRPVHAVLLVLAVGLVAGGIALAASGSNTIKGCVNKSTRVMTVPKPGDACPTNSNALTWNVRGPAGLSASASDSRNTAKAVTNVDQVLLRATIKIPARARIEASGGGTFQYTPSSTPSGAPSAGLVCGLRIRPPGGSSNPLGNRTRQDFVGTSAYEGTAWALGAAVRPAGTYVVTLRCNIAFFEAGVTFEQGDLNVVAAAP